MEGGRPHHLQEEAFQVRQHPTHLLRSVASNLCYTLAFLELLPPPPLLDPLAFLERVREEGERVRLGKQKTYSTFLKRWWILALPCLEAAWEVVELNPHPLPSFLAPHVCV